MIKGTVGVEAGPVDDTERTTETTCPSRTKSRVIGVEHWQTGGGTGWGLCAGVGTIGVDGLGSLGGEEYLLPNSGEAETVGELGLWMVESSR